MCWLPLRLTLAAKKMQLSNEILLDVNKEVAMLSLVGDFDIMQVSKNLQVAVNVVNEFLERLR